MKGVTFGTYHSYDDFSLILTSKEIAAPKTKTMKIAVECDCEPWKYKAVKTIITQAVSGESTISLPNLRKRVVPEVVIESDSAMHIVYNTYNVWDLGGGSYTLPELELKAGENTVSVTGTGNITFSYQEAGL